MMMVRGISRIKKRDGTVVDFNQDKITKAIAKAMESQGITDPSTSKTTSDIAAFMIEEKFGGYTVPSVEQIQDIVEMVLMKQGYLEVAKSYILYREKHKGIREAKRTGLNLERLIKDYINDADWKIRENSNEGVMSFSGLNARVSGEVLSTFALNQIYTENIKKAHVEGAFHIHDLSYPIVGYCAGWSLDTLLRRGFGHVPNQVHSSPAKHLETATLHMVNYIGTMQGEFAGAQAFSSVDTLLAPFIRKDNLPYEQVKQDVQKLIFGLNVPSRWGWQTPFSNLTFDWTVPDDMKDKKVVVGGKELEATYGEHQAEMDMINKAFLELMIEGDQKGRVFTFPIPTYNLTNDFDWDSPNANLLFEATAKYGIPYFQNYIGTNMSPGDIRAMCCRLNLDQRELMRRPGSIWGPGDSTGSIGVVTINLNRIGYEAQTKDEFLRKAQGAHDPGQGLPRDQARDRQQHAGPGHHALHPGLSRPLRQPLLDDRHLRHARGQPELPQEGDRHARGQGIRHRDPELHEGRPPGVPGADGPPLQPRGDAGRIHLLPPGPARQGEVPPDRHVGHGQASLPDQLHPAQRGRDAGRLRRPQPPVRHPAALYRRDHLPHVPPRGHRRRDLQEARPEDRRDEAPVLLHHADVQRLPRPRLPAGRASFLPGLRRPRPRSIRGSWAT